MTRPWVTLERVETADGPLELRRRGERDFLILLAGRVLMSSSANRSERALASQACARLSGRTSPSLLIGGLGMGFTLRAALDALPAAARVRVAELHPCVVSWCRGVLAPLTGGAALDPRVAIELGDVGARIRRAAPGSFDAILLDLYAGPGAGGGISQACFEPGMLAAARAALAPDGVYAVWSERPDPGFEKRLRAAGFDAVLSRPGRGGLRHAVYTATRSIRDGRKLADARCGALAGFWAHRARVRARADRGACARGLLVSAAVDRRGAVPVAGEGGRRHRDAARAAAGSGASDPVDAAGLVLGDGRGLRDARLRFRTGACALARLAAGGLRAARGAAAAPSASGARRCCWRARSSSDGPSSPPATSRGWRRCCCSACSAASHWLRSGRIWPGLALLAATPLVHPNGVWFLAAGAAWVWLWARRRSGLPRPGALGVAAVLCVALAWLAFAALAAAHPEAFAQGFAYQLARKAGAARFELLGDGRLLALAALLLLAARLRREVPDAVLLACLAVPALLAHSVGQEYWYEVFEELFYLLLSVLALTAAGLWLARRPALARHSRLATAGVLALLLLANGIAHRVPNPLGFPGNLSWHRMRVSDGEPYLRADERAFVRGFLTRLAPPGELPLVRFHPAAEALFYADLDGVEIRVSEPVFREQPPDWLLVRTSRFAASESFARKLLARAGIDPADPAHWILQRGEKRALVRHRALAGGWLAGLLSRAGSPDDRWRGPALRRRS